MKNHNLREAMETLVCLEQPPLYTTKPSLWNPKSPTFHPTTIKNLNLPTGTWKLHAEAKGFGGLPSTTPDKRIQEGIVTGKNSGKNEADDDQIPQVVFERMIVRILFSVGVPMAIGIGFLHLFGIVKDQHLWDVPIWLPFLTTLITFGTSAPRIYLWDSVYKLGCREKRFTSWGGRSSAELGLRCGEKRRMKARGDVLKGCLRIVTWFSEAHSLNGSYFTEPSLEEIGIINPQKV